MGEIKIIIIVTLVVAAVMATPNTKRVIYLDNLETIEIDTTNKIESAIEV